MLLLVLLVGACEKGKTKLTTHFMQNSTLCPRQYLHAPLLLTINCSIYLPVLRFVVLVVSWTKSHPYDDFMLSGKASKGLKSLSGYRSGTIVPEIGTIPADGNRKFNVALRIVLGV